MARNHRVVRGRSAKRLTSWLAVTPQRAVIATAGGTFLASLNAAALALRPFTVVRTRLLVTIESDQTGADEIQIGAFGAAVVSDQASAVGITAVPTPITDIGSDLWFLHQMLFASYTFISGVGIEAQMMTSYVVDSKAMRKVDIGQDIGFIAENDTGLGQGFTITIGGRMLIKVN